MMYSYQCDDMMNSLSSLPSFLMRQKHHLTFSNFLSGTLGNKNTLILEPVLETKRPCGWQCHCGWCLKIANPCNFQIVCLNS